MNSTGSACIRGLAQSGFRRVGWRWATLLSVAAAGLLAPFDHARGQWVEEPGNGWITLSVYHQDTRKFFAPDGDVETLIADGHSVTTSSFMTMALGLAEGVDFWSQLSFHRQRYDDSSAKRSSTGIGDARLWLRAAPLKWLGSGVPFALRAGFKIPVADFDVGADQLVLGDGQRDLEVMAELGHSFWPRSAYVTGWVGYRWRGKNQESGRTFANEMFYYAQIGGQVGRVGLRLSIDGWNGAPGGVSAGDSNPALERDLFQLLPSVQYDTGAGELGAGVRFALGGKNVTKGNTLVFRYFSKWELF